MKKRGKERIADGGKDGASHTKPDSTLVENLPNYAHFRAQTSVSSILPLKY